MSDFAKNKDVPDKNVGDTIYRQAAITTLCERRCGNKPKGCPSGFCTESLVVDCIPSAETQRWIPVTERLPDDGEDVLITFCGEEETRIVPVNYYQKIWFDCIYDIELNPHMVTAWMPLPAPWKGEEDE